MNFADAAAGQLLDDAAEFDENIAQLFGQTLTQSGLARTAQTNQSNVLTPQAANRWRFLQQSHQVALQGFGDLQKHQHGCVARA